MIGVRQLGSMFMDMSVFGYCPLPSLAKDSVHCEGQKILAVL